VVKVLWYKLEGRWFQRLPLEFFIYIILIYFENFTFIFSAAARGFGVEFDKY